MMTSKQVFRKKEWKPLECFLYFVLLFTGKRLDFWFLAQTRVTWSFMSSLNWMRFHENVQNHGHDRKTFHSLVYFIMLLPILWHVAGYSPIFSFFTTWPTRAVIFFAVKSILTYFSLHFCSFSSIVKVITHMRKKLSQMEYSRDQPNNKLNNKLNNNNRKGFSGPSISLTPNQYVSIAKGEYLSHSSSRLYKSQYTYR